MLSPAQGSLQERPFGELVRPLREARASGLLFVQNADTSEAVAVYLNRGDISNAESNQDAHSLQSQLLASGALNTAALESAVLQVEPGRPLTDVLFERQLLTRKQIAEHGARVTTAIVASLFRWTKGSYAFQEGDFAAKGIYPLNTPALLIEGAQQIPEFDSIRARILTDMRVLTLRSTPHEPPTLDGVGDSILARVDGTFTAADVCAASVSSEDKTCRILYALLLAGTIAHGDVTKAPKTTAKEAPKETAGSRPAPPNTRPSRPQKQAEPAPKPPRGAPSGAKKPEPVPRPRPVAAAGTGSVAEPYSPPANVEKIDASDGIGSLEPWQRDRLKQLDSLFLSLTEHDIHHVLKLAPGTSDATFDEAFHAVADPLHPKQNRWITDEAERTKLAFVHAKLNAGYKGVRGKAPVTRVTETFDAQSVKEIRREFTKTERQREADRRASDGSRHFAEASRQYDASRYHDARVEVLLAIKAMPEEAPYHALLARIDMLNPNIRWQKESETHWLNACALDRWNAEYRVGLAELYKKQGLAQKAKREFIRALELDPINETALNAVPVDDRPKTIEQFESASDD